MYIYTYIYIHIYMYIYTHAYHTPAGRHSQNLRALLD